MEIKITNGDELADYKREIERMEFQYSRAQEQINKFRKAISDYERESECARVAEIATGLSEKAKARLVFLGAGENSVEAVRDACGELLGKQIEELGSIATPLGLKVLAELQNVKPQFPERWGVFGVDSNRMYCECEKEDDSVTIRTALFRYGLSTFVRKI